MIRSKKRILTVLPVFLIIAGLSVIGVIFAWHRGAFLPSWVIWNNRSGIIETGRDDPCQFNVVLENRTLKVKNSEDSTVWESSSDLLVQDVLWGDIDHNGEKELMVLCWKIGKYGTKVPSREKEEHKWFQHIYIYEFRNGEVHPVWMASEIGMDVLKWDYSDEKRLHIVEKNSRETYWDWLSWGLEIIS